jgi:hypothetical protein
MIFKRQLRRLAILNFFLMWIPGVIIAGAISSYFNTGLIEFLMVLASLCALGMVYWTLQSLVQWVAFIVFERRMSRRHIFNYLIKNQYPEPNADEPSAEEYFLSVVKNRELDPEIRIKAAAEVGAFAAYVGAFERQQLRKISRAAKRAIKDYRLWLVNEKETGAISGPIAQQ